MHTDLRAQNLRTSPTDQTSSKHLWLGRFVMRRLEALAEMTENGRRSSSSWRVVCRVSRLFLTVGLVLSLSRTIAFAQALPMDVSTRIGRAGEFVYKYTPEQYATKLEDRDVYWNNQATSLQGGVDKQRFPVGVFSGFYTAVNRVPVYAQPYGKTRIITACGVPRGGGCTLEWFRKNHPRWIIYKADQVTPAYQFGDKNWIPLDISNPDVQSWFKAYVFAPVLDEGYQAISVDNVAAQNAFGEAGVCSIAPTTHCTADGGTWTQLYSGEEHNEDRRFAAARIEWAKTITAFAHSRGRSAMANVTYTPRFEKASIELINAFDLWFDETGFTGNNVPSDCSLNKGNAMTGKKWEEKVNFIVRLNGGRGPKGYIILNSICPFDSTARTGTFEIVEMAVATYMMVKNAHAYLWMFFSDGKDCGGAAYCDDRAGASWPQYYIEHGTARGSFSVKGGVYQRAFDKALALVNPNPNVNLSYDLGTGVYYRSDCSRWAGEIKVPRQSGLVLLRDTPAQCAGKLR